MIRIALMRSVLIRQGRILLIDIVIAVGVVTSGVAWVVERRELLI